MKKILFSLAFTFPLLLFSQKYHTKIKNSKVNSERIEISKNFIKEYFAKCENKNYSKFDQFTLDKRFERRLFENFQKTCENLTDKLGKINIKKLNSVYIQDFSKDRDPIEMIVFDADFEKSEDMKFVSIWIFRDQNIINAIRISKDKS
jgi:hypothetical protein